MPMIFKVLLGMQATTTTATATAGFTLDAGCFFASSKPILVSLRAQKIVWVKLSTGLRKCRWRDHPTRFS
jgi:hypothetical protein